MIVTKIFPIAMILLSLGAAVVYLYHKDYRQFIYWISGATITAAVTF